MNDCWPVTSWAIVDYFLRPKPAYFTIARELKPFTVGIVRKDIKSLPNERSAAVYTIDTILEIWGTNSTLSDRNVTLEVSTFDLHSGLIDKWTKEVVLAQNSSTEFHKGDLPGQPRRTNASEVPKALVVSARLLNENGGVLSRCSNWCIYSGRLEALFLTLLFRPEPFKFINFPAVEGLGFKITHSLDGESVELSTRCPIKGIVLDADGDDAKWSDQAIDLVPGDPQMVVARGLKARNVKARFLGDGSA
jgi:beta-mannosidase